MFLVEFKSLASLLTVLAGVSTSCPQAGDVDVNINLIFEEQPMITNMSTAEISAIFNTHPGARAHNKRSDKRVGMTWSHTDYRYKVTFDTEKALYDDTFCFTVKSVEYDIVYEPTIYIANDSMAVGNRTFENVLAHEREHVSVTYNMMQDYIPLAKKELEKYVNKIPVQGMMKRDNLKPAKQEIMDDIVDLIRRLQEALGGLVDKANAKVDADDKK